MRFVINTKELGKEDVDYVKKGLKGYLELFDVDATVNVLQLGDMEMLAAIELLSGEILWLREELRQHSAIGTPWHNWEE